jgi:hypothetical protein
MRRQEDAVLPSAFAQRQTGLEVAPSLCMVDEQGTERRGAQQESPAEREAKNNPAEQQDLEQPSEGRDAPPAEKVDRGERDPESPWMGGG